MIAARAAVSSVGVAALASWEVHEVRGRDALDLFQRISTQDLRDLGPGRSATTLFLTPTGRIVRRVVLVRGPATLVAVSEPGTTPLPDWVDRYTFGEDARLAPSGGALLVAGPAAARALGIADLLPGASTSLASGDLVARRDLGALPAFLVAAAPPGPEALAARLLADGAVLLDDDARRLLRVALGVAEGGCDLTDDTHPLEAGLAAEISFTKGCYVGQEVVARQDAYGKVARRLSCLLFKGAPCRGDALDEARDGCSITSVAPEALPGEEGPRCLGYVRARTAVIGQVVRTVSGLEGRVVEAVGVSLAARDAAPA